MEKSFERAQPYGREKINVKLSLKRIISAETEKYELYLIRGDVFIIEVDELGRATYASLQSSLAAS